MIPTLVLFGLWDTQAKMLLKKTPDISPSEITPQHTYLCRREFLASAGATIAALALGGFDVSLAAGDKLAVTKRMVTTTDPPTSYNAITTYNNFYEFGSNKSDPARNAQGFKPKPWSVAVEGACGKPGVYTLEDVLRPHALEERVYRHRCVEGWSIVVPWIGFPLGDLLKRFEPTASATFVEFVTVVRPGEMVGQRGRFFSLLPWPYNEGLRMDEAMHSLTLVAVGLYGEELPNQNGAPLRLVVPWKYGFKSIKSIVKIRFIDKQPVTTWMKEAPNYYGFYSNVNPGVTNSTFRDQSTERRLGELLMRKTLPFNGYADQVGSLYAGMDLRKQY
jgi:methionine sulfoxide reductase catalytic subunit